MAVKAIFKEDPRATASSGLCTSGPGLFYGLSITTTAATGLRYVSVYDASAVSASVYSYHANGSPTADNRLLWVQQVNAGGSAGASITPPPVGLHFFHGLVVGMSNFTGTAGAAEAMGVCVVLRNGFPSNNINA